MNKTMKRNVVVSAVLAIMLCVSLIAGATFALFTSESKVNIAVTSGKVEVVAEIDNVVATHPEKISVTEGPSNYVSGFFGGSASIHENTLTLDNMVAGDKVTFDIVITNYSSVAVKFRTISTKTGDDELINALNINAGSNTGWMQLAAAPRSGAVVNTMNCSVELPYTANVQEKSCAISFTVEAVQGNADVEIDNNTLYIATADELITFANSVNAYNRYAGKTVYLTADIDLAGTDFNGIGGMSTASFPGYAFNGTFDGQGHTIKNMTVANSIGNNSAVGFFGTLGNNAIVKNVNFENANVSGTHYAGVVAGYCANARGVITAVIENCDVINSTVTSAAWEKATNTYDDGEKVGGIIGYSEAKVSGCTVKNTTVKGVRDLGGIVGISYAVTENCTVDGVSIYADNSKQVVGNGNGTNLDYIVGRKASGYAINNCTYNNSNIYNATYYISTAADLIAYKNGVENATRDTSAILLADITLTDAWEPIVCEYGVTRSIAFDGNGHSISNIKNTAETLYGGLFGKIEIINGSSLTIKDLTLKQVAFVGNKTDGECAGAALIGWLESHSGEAIEINNVKVEDVDVKGFKFSGGLIGNATIENMTVANCSVEGGSVDTINHAGGLLGYLAISASGASATVSACTVKNVAVKSTEGAGLTNGRQGAVVGSLQTNCTIASATISGVTVMGASATAEKAVGSVNAGSVGTITVE